MVGDPPWQMENERRRVPGFLAGGVPGPGSAGRRRETRNWGRSPPVCGSGRDGTKRAFTVKSGPNFTPEEINPRKFISRNRPVGQWEHHQSVINASLNSCLAGLRRAR